MRARRTAGVLALAALIAVAGCEADQQQDPTATPTGAATSSSAGVESSSATPSPSPSPTPTPTPTPVPSDRVEAKGVTTEVTGSPTVSNKPAKEALQVVKAFYPAFEKSFGELEVDPAVHQYSTGFAEPMQKTFAGDRKAGREYRGEVTVEVTKVKATRTKGTVLACVDSRNLFTITEGKSEPGSRQGVKITVAYTISEMLGRGYRVTRIQAVDSGC